MVRNSVVTAETWRVNVPSLFQNPHDVVALAAMSVVAAANDRTELESLWKEI
jgi:hypothetical protein